MQWKQQLKNEKSKTEKKKGYAQTYRDTVRGIGNESVPKIVINNAVNLFFKTATSFLVISNHSSFRVLFDKIASIYFI